MYALYVICMGLLFGALAFSITQRKGWAHFPPMARAVFGFVFSLLGVIVLACIPSPLASQEKYWQEEVRKARSDAQRARYEAKLASVRAKIAAQSQMAR